jgi:hypothetical protein
MVKDTYLIAHKRKVRSPHILALEILVHQFRNEFSLCTSINKQRQNNYTYNMVQE